MNEDPRLGKVSASRLEIAALCPGSEQLRRSLPPEALQSDEDAYTESGKLLHEAWQTDNTLNLDEDQVAIYTKGNATLQSVVNRWSEERETSYTEQPRELRLWLHDDLLRPLTSGQLDRHYLGADGFNALVVDFKSLWSPNLTPAERNWQGRLQAVLAAEEYGAQHVRVAFVKAMFGTADQVDYDASALAYAKQSILAALWETEQPGAQLRPGRWCTHCPCKGYCEEAAAYAQLPTVTTQNGDPMLLVQVMPPEDLVQVWRKKALIEKILKAVQERLKGLPPEELGRLGLKLTKGSKSDKVKDVKGAFQKLLSTGYSEDQLFAIMSFGKGDAVEMIRDKTALGKKDAAEWWESALSEFIEPGRTAPSLKEDK